MPVVGGSWSVPQTSGPGNSCPGADERRYAGPCRPPIAPRTAGRAPARRAPRRTRQSPARQSPDPSSIGTDKDPWSEPCSRPGRWSAGSRLPGPAGSSLGKRARRSPTKPTVKSAVSPSSACQRRPDRAGHCRRHCASANGRRRGDFFITRFDQISKSIWVILRFAMGRAQNFAASPKPCPISNSRIKVCIQTAKQVVRPQQKGSRLPDIQIDCARLAFALKWQMSKSIWISEPAARERNQPVTNGGDHGR